MTQQLAPRPQPAQAWADAAARVHADLVESSDFVERVAPLLGPQRNDLLDIGAGNGLLGARLMARGGRWQAVEQNWTLRRRLRQLRPALSLAGVELQILGSPWQHLLPETQASDVIVSSPVVARSDPQSLFKAMRRRWRRTMAWVITADRWPEAFPLAPPERGEAPSTVDGSLVDRVLDALGQAQEPRRMHLVQWTVAAPAQEATALQPRATVLTRALRRSAVLIWES